MQVNVLEAKNRLSELIRSASAGEDVVIANRGRPVARLIAAQPPDTSGSAAGILDWLARNPLPAHARRSSAQIESDILEERNAWD